MRRPSPSQGGRDEFADLVRENMPSMPLKKGVHERNGGCKMVRTRRDMAGDESQTSRTDRGMHSKAHSDLFKRMKELRR